MAKFQILAGAASESHVARETIGVPWICRTRSVTEQRVRLMAAPASAKSTRRREASNTTCVRV